MAAKKKQSLLQKTVKKGAKKTVKKAKKNKKLVFIFVFIVFCLIGFLAFNVYKEKSTYDKYTEYFSDFETVINLPNEVEGDIELPVSFKEVKVIWTSSDETLISLAGKVNQPKYDEGDKVVTLRTTIPYDPQTFMYNAIKSTFNIEDFVYEKKITVKAKQATDEDYIVSVLDNLFMPNETFESIGFVTDTCYDNVKLSYASSNEAVISNNGTVTTPATDTDVNITVTCKTENKSIDRVYKVKVLAENYVVDLVNTDFNSLDVTSKYGNVSLDGVTYYNVRVVETEGAEEVDPSEANEAPHELRLRTNNKATDEALKYAYFETSVLNNPTKLTFNYKFDGTQTTENSQFEVYAKTTSDYEKIQTINVLRKEVFEKVEIDLSTYSTVQIKVVYVHGWSAETFVRIDDVKITSNLSDSDLEGTVSIISNFSRSMFLPFTTRLGGSVVWASSDEAKITKNGKLIDGATGKVTLTATIQLGSLTKVETFEVTIKTGKSGGSDPVEIYFIDLGTYGIGDCGECTYIKYNDIDIIVDGGDHFDSTTRSISEVFEAHTNDKVIDYLIVTHPDSDHIGGLPYLFETYQINNVYKFAEETFTTQKFKNFKKAYDSEPNCNVYDVYYDMFQDKKVSDKLVLSDDVYLKFINTGYLLDKETNGRSVVFELYAYDTKVLMTGDADNGGSHTKLEEDYMNQLDDIDILKVCHHATEKGTYDKFLQACTPEVCVICNGNYLGNKHSHPNKAPLERMQNYCNSSCKDLKIYAITGGGIHAEATSDYAYRGSCTLEESKIDRNGTITCTIDNAGYSFECSLREDILDIRNTQYWGILFGTK